MIEIYNVVYKYPQAFSYRIKGTDTAHIYIYTS